MIRLGLQEYKPCEIPHSTAHQKQPSYPTMIFKSLVGPLALCSLAVASPTNLARRGTIASSEIGKFPNLSKGSSDSPGPCYRGLPAHILITQLDLARLFPPAPLVTFTLLTSLTWMW